MGHKKPKAVFITTQEDYHAFVADPDFKDCEIRVSDGTQRPDMYDGLRGGLWLTKKGTLRKRVRNTTSRVFRNGI
jgi:hypothetical protein